MDQTMRSDPGTGSVMLKQIGFVLKVICVAILCVVIIVPLVMLLCCSGEAFVGLDILCPLCDLITALCGMPTKTDTPDKNAGV